MSLQTASASLRVLVPELVGVLGAEEFAVEANPFRVGRGMPIKGKLLAALARTFKAADYDRQDEASDLHLALPEKAENRYVSKEHFSIVFENGQYYLVDDGSSLGTIVEGKLIGGKRAGGRTVLRHHDVIVVGAPRSGFIFKFVVRRVL